MPLNPLEKLKRFASNAPVPPPAPSVPVRAVPKVQAPLTDEAKALLAKSLTPNAKAFACECCAGKGAEPDSIFFMKTSSFGKWLCLTCYKFLMTHGRLPKDHEIPAPRVIPKKALPC